MNQDERNKVFSTIDYLVSIQVSNQMPISEAERAWNNLLTNVPKDIVAEGLTAALINLEPQHENCPLAQQIQSLYEGRKQ
tara:strand:+ start:656 stop:895 length:240 start_codon:yes stop_codon:yes gene_type:complete